MSRARTKSKPKTRQASCRECGKKTKSDPSLVFFLRVPDSKYDAYYCGCNGWE